MIVANASILSFLSEWIIIDRIDKCGAQPHFHVEDNALKEEALIAARIQSAGI